MGGLATAVLLAVVAPSPAAAAGTAGVAFSAHGSVQQVYVLGAQPGERLTLLDRRGRDGHDCCGRTAWWGDLPRRRPRPGLPRPAHEWRRATNTHSDGFTGPIGAAEHADLRAADPEVRLRLPDHEGRDQAGDRRAPPGRPGPLRDARGVLGVRLCRSGRGAERDQPDRDAARFRGRRREHARDGLLGRGVQLLRAAPEPRRVRRDRDGGAAALGARTTG